MMVIVDVNVDKIIHINIIIHIINHDVLVHIINIINLILLHADVILNINTYKIIDVNIVMVFYKIIHVNIVIMVLNINKIIHVYNVMYFVIHVMDLV